ncbi:MAG: hypothetical protein K2L31_07750 [Muribaculum sp.]|nr:hypothetical protein [Muribaculum sp.]
MTFEEFKKMAGAEPELNCKSIFKVEMYFIGLWDMNDNGEKIAPYVESTTLDLDVPEVYYLLTFEEAKQLILSEQAKHSDSFHSARVIELPIGLPIHDEEYLSITVFDKNAEITFCSRLPTVEGLTDVEGNDVDTTFYGYAEKDMPYHEGEIVEVMDGENNVVRLGIVVDTPVSLEDNWKHGKETGGFIDVLDRFRIMIDNDICQYFGTGFILRPSFPVSDNIKKCLKKWYKNRPDEGSTDFAGLLQFL